mmetsp:Transcript_112459/g.312895  ORF Transcript_112459/g.312895 Transcript_112459/m.312895 type:complete len:202 (+) Transcript_112459:585-1190(+)
MHSYRPPRIGHDCLVLPLWGTRRMQLPYNLAVHVLHGTCLLHGAALAVQKAGGLLGIEPGKAKALRKAAHPLNLVLVVLKHNKVPLSIPTSSNKCSHVCHEPAPHNILAVEVIGALVTVNGEPHEGVTRRLHEVPQGRPPGGAPHPSVRKQSHAQLPGCSKVLQHLQAIPGHCRVTKVPAKVHLFQLAQLAWGQDPPHVRN